MSSFQRPHLTVIAPIEMSKAKWVVAGLVPGLERQLLKKIDTDAERLLPLLQRWRAKADQAGHAIKRIAVAYEAAGNGFWLARWLRARGGRTASGRPWSANRRGSLIASRQFSLASALAASA